MHRRKVPGTISLALALFTSTNAIASDLFKAIFNSHKAAGTLVIEQLSSGKRWIHNAERAQKRYLPASTFKIPHTIIALDLKIEPSIDTIIPWDGKQRRIRSWNKDQNLRDAFRNSAVPAYQNIARRIGLQKMQRAIDQLGYGNGKIGKNVDQFWLKGPLRISVNEQIGFLKQLHALDLPFDTDAQKQTIKIMARRRSGDMVHRGKTGWEIASNPDIGWYVGWQETAQDTWFFALNMNMERREHRKSRIEIVEEALKVLLAKAR